MRGALDITSPEFTWGKTDKQVRDSMRTAEECKAIARVRAGDDIAEVAEDYELTVEWLNWAMS